MKWLKRERAPTQSHPKTPEVLAFARQKFQIPCFRGVLLRSQATNIVTRGQAENAPEKSGVSQRQPSSEDPTSVYPSEPLWVGLFKGTGQPKTTQSLCLPQLAFPSKSTREGVGEYPQTRHPRKVVAFRVPRGPAVPHQAFFKRATGRSPGRMERQDIESRLPAF